MVPYDSAGNYYNDRPTTHCIVCGKKLQLSNEFDKCTDCAFGIIKKTDEAYKESIKTLNEYRNRHYNNPSDDERKLALSIDKVFQVLKKNNLL